MSELSDHRLKQLSVAMGVGSALVVAFVAFAFLPSGLVRWMAVGIAVLGATVQPVILYRVMRSQRDAAEAGVPE